MKGAFRASGRMPGLLFLLLLVGCHSSDQQGGNEGTNFHAFATQGVIEKIAPDRSQVTIHHETIPGYMMEMTMEFPASNPEELKDLIPGDEITFTLNVTQDRDWVSDLHRIGHTDLAMSGVMSVDETPKLKTGDKMPDGELIAEDGRHIHLSDFQGRVVALTFFFTRCPLPNYSH